MSRTTPSAVAAASDSVPKMWYFRSTPTERAVADDASPPQPELLQAFKMGLNVNERPHFEPQAVFVDRSLPCIQQLQSIDTRVGAPPRISIRIRHLWYPQLTSATHIVIMATKLLARGDQSAQRSRNAATAGDRVETLEQKLP